MPHKDPAERRAYNAMAMRRRRAKARAEKWEAREEKVLARPSHPVADLIWAAGLFEGEGTITLTPSRDYVRPHVTLTSTDREVVDFFHERWPGYLSSHKPSKRAKEALTWGLNASLAIECFLLDIMPHLRTSRVSEKAKIVLADIRDRMPYQNNPPARQRSAARMTEIRRLNHRGEMPKMLPGPTP